MGNEMEMLVFDNAIVREITNGMLAFASFFLCFPLYKYLSPKMRKNWRIWEGEIETRLAWSLSLYATGSCMRATWVWLTWLSGRNQWEVIHQFMYSISIIGYLAVIFMLWGMFCTMKTLRQARYNDPRYITPKTSMLILTTISIPIIIFVFV